MGKDNRGILTVQFQESGYPTGCSAIIKVTSKCTAKQNHQNSRSEISEPGNYRKECLEQNKQHFKIFPPSPQSHQVLEFSGATLAKIMMTHLQLFFRVFTSSFVCGCSRCLTREGMASPLSLQKFLCAMRMTKWRASCVFVCRPGGGT